MGNVTAFRLPRKKAPSPPSGLGSRGRSFWIAVAEEYGIDDAAGLELLRQAAELLDRIAQARARVKKDSVLIRDRDGALRTHPAWRIERDARAAFLATLRTLNLDLEPLRDRAGRPGGR